MSSWSLEYWGATPKLYSLAEQQAKLFVDLLG